MQTIPLRRAVRAAVLALALGASASSFAVPLMDMRAEDMLPMVSELGKELNLNPNQQILWHKVESGSREILRQRVDRRARLQEQAKGALEKKDVELRELNALIEAEANTSAAEDKQLREMWLTVNDALDDGQRRKVATFVSEQMQRVERPDAPRGAPKGDESGGRGRRGGGRMGGGAGGMHMPGSGGD
ncbi:hypothetical protein GCM10027321_37870 [Massilia terrae]|uniref:Periplasmic heavy metal sensor n=1 Tax=Massilia terrae TaxID=1811224 RepID=A0ABT2D4N1_9BURK|nr:hypothetical protein [Massilia terrae]MCS0661084.1 hypothetical protein [Massilia terrae]